MIHRSEMERRGEIISHLCSISHLRLLWFEKPEKDFSSPRRGIEPGADGWKARVLPTTPRVLACRTWSLFFTLYLVCMLFSLDSLKSDFLLWILNKNDVNHWFYLKNLFAIVFPTSHQIYGQKVAFWSMWISQKSLKLVFWNFSAERI